MKKTTLRVPASRPRNPFARAARARHAGAHRDRRRDVRADDWREDEWMLSDSDGQPADDTLTIDGEGEGLNKPYRPAPAFINSPRSLFSASV